MRSTSSSSPKCSGVPRPLSPSTPVACASSTATRAPYLRASSTMPGRSATWPLIEDAIGDDHAPARLARVSFEQTLQVFQIVVPVLSQAPEGEPRPIVEAGVVLAV